MSDQKINTHHNLSREQLVQFALDRKEGVIVDNGALLVETGHRTGRSPKDRFIVKDDLTSNKVDWGSVNQPISPEDASQLWDEVSEFIKDQETFTQDLQVGASKHYALKVRTINTEAWHSLFVKNLFIEQDSTLSLSCPQWTLLSAPWFQCDPARHGTHSDGCVIIDFTQQRVLLAGMRYAGEMKKSFFSVMNFLMPNAKVLPMHCAANTDEQEENVTLFFGLSGTGKTTLSADPHRKLVGDDEHGWTSEGVFNFEGGCYAKCINITEASEPLIWRAIRSGTVLENVVANNGQVDYADTRITANSRAAYTREFIPNCVQNNQANTPSQVIFLSCDLYGVLPPLSLLSIEQAAYYFLSGYTALVGSTEVGSTSSIKPTFSVCFGAAFFPYPAKVYADLLMRYLRESNAKVYLMNTGWHQGRYGQGGTRYPLAFTRALIESIHSGEINHVQWQTMPNFKFKIPEAVGEYTSKSLNPILSWSNEEEYWSNAGTLIQSFQDNFKKFDLPSIAQFGPVQETVGVV
ncbi:MAG: phosphoenolpyruvate carboxykinase (ATP) [Legionellales bacterium]|nr:phosphoenolpyruvate carboxykinase (ATP) [Legionellales bacterium]OUX66904.1 MAG: phosphoenolpyruvate carboxykinase (ATP) [bacterium TMED178]